MIADLRIKSYLANEGATGARSMDDFNGKLQGRRAISLLAGANTAHSIRSKSRRRTRRQIRSHGRLIVRTRFESERSSRGVWPHGRERCQVNREQVGVFYFISLVSKTAFILSDSSRQS